MLAGGVACLECDYSVKAAPKGVSLSAGDEFVAIVGVVTGSMTGRIILGTLALGAVITAIMFVVEGSGLLDLETGPQTATPNVNTWNRAAPLPDNTVATEDSPVTAAPNPATVEADDPQERQSEIERLQRWAQQRQWDEESRPHFLAAMRSDDESLATAAVEGLKLIGPVATESLTEMISVGNAVVLRRVAEVLTAYGPRAWVAMEPLIESSRLLADDTLTALTRTNRHEALRAVAAAMAAINPAQVETRDWIAMLDEEDGDVTVVATRVLLARHQSDPIETTVALQHLLLALVGSEQLSGDPARSLEARHTAAKLLVAITTDAPSQVIRELTRMMTSVEHAGASEAIAVALGEYGARSVKPVLAVKVEALMRAADVEPVAPIFAAPSNAIGGGDDGPIGGAAWEVDAQRVVARADDALARVGDSAVTELLEIVDSPGDAAMRTTALETAAPLLPGHEIEAIPVLVANLRSPLLDDRCRELILGLPPDPRAAVPELLGVEYLATGSEAAEQKRGMLMGYLEKLGSAGLPLIKKLLTYPSPAVQRASVAILGRAEQSEQVMDAVLTALGCSDPGARRNAVTIIVIYGQDAVPGLKALAKDTNPNTNERDGARQALKLLGAG